MIINATTFNHVNGPQELVQHANLDNKITQVQKIQVPNPSKSSFRRLLRHIWT